MFLDDLPAVVNGHKQALMLDSTVENATGKSGSRGILQHCCVPYAVALMLLVLVGCSRGGGEDASPATPAAPATYPDLASVPQRPHLSYSVEQRRAIADALIADRENARYRQAELDYATGRSSLPPPPSPPSPGTSDAESPAPAAAPKPPPAGDAEIARAYVDEALTNAQDDGDLKDFMDRLQRPPPDMAGPETVDEALTPPEQQAAASPAAERPRPGALRRFGSYLGGMLGIGGDDEAPREEPKPEPVVAAAPPVLQAESPAQAEAEPAAPPAQAVVEPVAPPLQPSPAPPAAVQPDVLPPAPTVVRAPDPVPARPTAPATTLSQVRPPMGPVQQAALPVARSSRPAAPLPVLPIGSAVARLPFPSGSATMDAALAERALGRALELARAAKAGLRIVAPPGDGALGRDRARNVAVELMQLGAPADLIDMSTGGSGNEVVVYLARPKVT